VKRGGRRKERDSGVVDGAPIKSNYFIKTIQRENLRGERKDGSN